MFHFRELLHTKRRQVDTCERLNAVLGDSCLSCELQLAGPEYEGFQQGFSCLPPSVAEELFSSNLSDDESFLQALTPELTQLKKTKVSFDNSLSPAHTLLKILCVDQKSLLYDITRTLKDFNIKVGSSCFILYSSFSLFIYFFVLVFLRLKLDGVAVSKNTAFAKSTHSPACRQSGIVCKFHVCTIQTVHPDPLGPTVLITWSK